MKRCLFLVFAFIYFHPVSSGPLERIARAMEKKDYESVEKLIAKAWQKEPHHPGLHYYQSVLFLQTDYSKKNIDSAHFHIKLALQGLGAARLEIKEDMAKAALDEQALQAQHLRTDSSAYVRAIDPLTLGSLNFFLHNYPDADQTTPATYKRDSLAYSFAREEDSWKAYLRYLEDYPESSFRDEAQQLFDKRVFEDYSQDGDWKQYARFLEKYPNTPYREAAETYIFRHGTGAGGEGELKEFLAKYKSGAWKKQVYDLLYWASENNDRILRGHPQADSILRLEQLQQETWVPVMKDQSYGFINEHGKLRLKHQYQEVPTEYLCGLSNERLLLVKTLGKWHAVNRNGQVTIGSSDEIRAVGMHFYLAKQKSLWLLHHISGHQIPDITVTDAKQLSKSWVAVKQGAKWGIVTLTGNVLIQPRYDTIELRDGYVLLYSGEYFHLLTTEQVVSGKWEENAVRYDDFTIVDNDLLHVFLGEQEGLLNPDLSPKIKLQGERIYVHRSVIYIKRPDGYMLKGTRNLKEGTYPSILVNGDWAALKSAEGWLVHSLSDPPLSALADTTYFLGDFAMLYGKGEDKQLLFKNGTSYRVGGLTEEISVTSSKDTPFLALRSNGRILIYNQKGNLLLNKEGDEVSFISDTLFRVKQGKYYGLYATNASTVLKPEYDMISPEGSLLLLLKNNKIGAYDLENGLHFAHKYDSKIVRLGKNYLIRTKEGAGIVNDQGNIIVPSKFEAVRAWSDSAYWVKENDYWKIWSLTGAMDIGEMEDLETLPKLAADECLLVKTSEGMGVMSRKHGLIIPPKYNDILNLGTGEKPVFFAEQHLETAAFYVVTYFDGEGSTIHSQAYRPDEYDRIYCDD